MKSRGIEIRQVLVFVGLIVLFYLIMDFNNRMATLHHLSAQEEKVAARATAVMGTQAALETQIAFATSDEAVEAWARESGRMVLPGDQPVVPIPPPGSTPEPTPVPLATPELVENWEVWLALFIDPQP